MLSFKYYFLIVSGNFICHALYWLFNRSFFFIYKLHGAHKPIICTVLRTLCRGSSLYEEDQQVTQQNKSTEDYEKDFVIEEPKRRCDSISLYNNKNENKEPYLYTHTAAQV